MSDLKMKFDPDLFSFDLSFSNNDFEVDEGLETAVMVSLFTDGRVSDIELPFGQFDKKGWWADAIDIEENDQIGSKLWLLAREKQTPAVLERSREYCRDALQWLLDDGIASSIDVQTSYPETGSILIEIQIMRASQSSIKFSFNVVWEGQANAI